MEKRNGALEGIKVLDVSQVAAAPVCARHLADFGADVLHIENGKTGDFWRSYLSGVAWVSAVPSNVDYNWEVWNRNKKSVAIDLKTVEGQGILHKLAKQADVFVTNLRMFEREKFACSYQYLKSINPGIIYGSITGVGSKGPERDAPGYDQTALWFRSGVNYVLTPRGMPDIGFRAALGDSVAGMSLYGGIMTALYHREKTGVGQEVEVSLLGTGLYQLSFDVAGALVTGRDFNEMYSELEALLEQSASADPGRAENSRLMAAASEAVMKAWDNQRMNTPNALAGGYFTRDGRYVHINILQPDRYWEKWCHAMGLEHLIGDPRFVEHEVRLRNNRDLYLIVKEAIASRDLKDVYRRLTDNGIPFAVRQSISEVIRDPQARENGYFVKFEHPEHGTIEIPASPISLSETPASYRLPAPEFSRHTEETLLEIGFNWEDIASLKEKGVIP